MSALVRGCVVVGGLAWVARWWLDRSDASAGATDAAYWTGAVLLAVGLAGSASGLASASARWLQAFTAVAIVLLAACVLLVAHDATGAEVALDALVGAVAALAWLVPLARRRAARPARQRVGSHSR